MTAPLPTTIDCLILGGGVVGLSIAYELSGRGVQATVVDRQPPGREASWAGAGILPPGSLFSDHPACEALARLSRTLNAQWSANLHEQTGIDNEYRQCGGIHVAADGADRQALGQLLARWENLGIESRAINGSELRQMEPTASARLVELANQFGAFHIPGETQLRNPRHLAALAAGCERRGVTIVYPVVVDAVDRWDDREIVFRTSAGPCTAGRVIFAAGAWSAALTEWFGVTLSIKPMRGQMVLFGPQATAPLQGNVHSGPHYAVVRRDGRVIVGSTVEDVGFDKRTTLAATAALEAWGRTSFDSLASAAVERVWAGLRPASSDGLPYLGRLPTAHNAYVAAGHFRSGLQFATGTAVALADLIEGKSPPFDLEPLRPDR